MFILCFSLPDSITWETPLAGPSVFKDYGIEHTSPTKQSWICRTWAAAAFICQMTNLIQMKYCVSCFFLPSGLNTFLKCVLVFEGPPIPIPSQKPDVPLNNVFRPGW